MTLKKWLILLMSLSLVLPTWAQDEDEECDIEPDTRTFTQANPDECRFRNRYNGFEKTHPYWIMEPGWQIMLEGEDDEEFITLEITVLDETEIVDGVRCRVIEEREYVDEELYEVSRNFFAICTRTNDIYYFGEDVDFYEDGEIVSHEGAWRAGEDGAAAGIIMPGTPMAGARFFQEMAPNIAEDRAEIMEIGAFEVGEETFEKVVVFREDSPLDDPCDFSMKYYAAGIGMVVDDDLEIVWAGWAYRVPPGPIFKDE